MITDSSAPSSNAPSASAVKSPAGDFIAYAPPDRMKWSTDENGRPQRSWIKLDDLPAQPAFDLETLGRSARVLLDRQESSGSFLAPELYFTGDRTDDQIGGAAVLAAALALGRVPPVEKPFLNKAVRYHLEHLVWQSEDTGFMFLRYVADRPTPNDWCATLWALHGAVLTLEHGRGILDPDLELRLRRVCADYWRFLSSYPLKEENPCHNQLLEYCSIGFHAGKVLGDDRVAAEALAYYFDYVRGLRVPLRGRLIYGEFNQWCSHYFLLSWFAVEKLALHTGNAVIEDDAREMAAAFDDRLSAGGFFYGGSRYDEAGVEELMFPLWRRALQFDFGRTLVPGPAGRHRRITYDGHFGKALVGRLPLYAHPRPSSPPATPGNPATLRRKHVSLNLDEAGKPWLLSVAGVEFLQARRLGACSADLLWRRDGGVRIDPLMGRNLAASRNLSFQTIRREQFGGLESLRSLRRGALWELRNWWLASDDSLVWLVHAINHADMTLDSADLLLACPFLASDDRHTTTLGTVGLPGHPGISLYGGPDLALSPGELSVGGCRLAASHPLCVCRPSSSAAAGFPLPPGTLWRDVTETNFISLQLVSEKTSLACRQGLWGAVVFGASTSAEMRPRVTVAANQCEIRIADIGVSAEARRGVWHYTLARGNSRWTIADFGFGRSPLDARMA